jgi:hypothetical protein
LLCFIFGFLLLLTVLGLLASRNADFFEGAAHKGLAKAAMIARRPRVNYIFLGTSRTQDGVSPVLISRAFHETYPATAVGEAQGFNAAYPGASLDELAEIAPRYLGRHDLQAVIFELSEPQARNEGKIPEELIRRGTSSETVTTLEDRLARKLEAIDLIRYRTAFRDGGRLLTLLFFSSSISGWEVRGNDLAGAWLGKKEKSATDFNLSRWNPEVLRGGADPQSLNQADEAAASRFTKLAKLFAGRGIKVVFAVPPLTREAWSQAPERDAMRPMFYEIARRTGAEVWNFAYLNLPGSFFRNESHLDQEGRAQYSQALAAKLAPLLERAE